MPDVAKAPVGVDKLEPVFVFHLVLPLGRSNRASSNIMLADDQNFMAPEYDLLGARDVVRTLAIFAFVSAILVAEPGAVAQTSSPANLTLPAQPLDEALDAYASATGLQMLYDASLARGRRSSPVVAAPNARAGLDVLLRGTGLSARFTGGGAVIVYANTSAVELNPITAVAAPSIGRSSPNPAALAYVELVQADLIRLIREDGTLSRENYRLGIAVWVSGAGSVDKIRVIRGSGRDALDALFLQVVLDAPLSAPPPDGLPQPLRIELIVRQRG